MDRVLLKLSGEALAGSAKKGLDNETVRKVARQVKEITDAGIRVGIVIGGGNFWRGDEHEAEIERTKGDQIGMLATVMNCIYVSEVFRGEGIGTEICTPFAIGAFTHLYSKDFAMKALSEGKVVFFAGGTGHPYFSTDTATVLRALEIEADTILMAKSIDGVYDKDPAKYADAKRFDRITIDEVVKKELGVIDAAAAVMVKENHMPLFVFDLNAENAIAMAAKGLAVGTEVVPD
ncbi:MAG: UMP kinase [Lachnospiraceae bacterium]|nr:UMP kinase [Lachnospiraceae bacterium]